MRVRAASRRFIVQRLGGASRQPLRGVASRWLRQPWLAARPLWIRAYQEAEVKAGVWCGGPAAQGF